MRVLLILMLAVGCRCKLSYCRNGSTYRKIVTYSW